ncbi:SufS family cysteine desulfurase [Iamia majanohamensis]|uniref:cysteine desulfurase n=1 Tax=Iamia majanohamensis TaxID=467976 RepID=A0AAE9Y429_9ACTN|nr:SufS family cysteine desulfurase [Iamia majanohamensis]WCO65794.1 SufS family cysteine desulfurase [Iamia majanohamensis]
MTDATTAPRTGPVAAEVGPAANPADTLDVAAIRRDFPVLAQERDGRRLVFLDSAASAQKPRAVIEAMSTFAESEYANVHRGVYALAERATARMEEARAAVARFIGAPRAEEVVFTKNATEGLNLVAGSWGRANLGPGDVVVLTQMEHHANIVPWFQLQAEKGFEIRWIPVGPDHQLDLTDLDRLLDGAKLVGLTAMSNVLGTLPPVRAIADAAHAAGALVCLDACQYVPHLATDVVALGADFVAFSAHKMVGPTGIGVLWGRSELLESMPPFLGGGGMILTVDLEGFTPDAPPSKFEAGTPPIIEAIGLHAAIDYLDALGMDAVRAHEVSLTAYALRTLTERLGDRLTIHGPSEPAARGGVLSLAVDDVHPHDLAQVMDEHNVCVRPGHHCAKPLMKVLGVGATARASLYLYNDTDDVDALAEALVAAADFFAF